MNQDEKDLPVPSKGELDALKILWAHGPATVRFVHELLVKKSKTVRYTSTLKMMQLMAEKGMVGRDESKMTHVYFALLEEKPTMATIANRFVQSMYNGSISELLVAFMGNKPPSTEELDEMKALLRQMETTEK